MAVAKTYEHMKIITEPYVGSSGRKYVRVSDSCDRCGGSGIWHYGPYGGTCFKCNGSGKVVQEVRWYSDAERARMDARNEAHAEEMRQKREAEILRQQGPEFNGFGNGYVVIIYGNTYPIKDELKAAGAHFKRSLGWYFSNEADVPECYANQSMKITWEMVSKDNRILSEIDIMEIIKNVLPKEEVKSTYQGSVGERMRGLELTVVKFWEGAGYYIHTMEDADGNVFVWMTSSRAIQEGSKIRLDATVKKHEEYNGVPQTYLTRPSIKEMIV